MADIYLKEGAYTGNGTTQTILNLGFTPKIVLIKADSTANSNTVYMTDTLSIAHNITNATTNPIITIVSGGFSVSDDSSYVNGRTNQSAKEYYYVALGGSGVVTNTYSGNLDATQAITGVGFLPVMVWVKRANQSDLYMRTTDMTTYSISSFVSSSTIQIVSLDADGFTVGSHAGVNLVGNTYHYAAFNATSTLHVGKYISDNAASRDLPAVAMSFDPSFVWIKQGAGAQNAVYTTTTLDAFIDETFDVADLEAFAGGILDLNISSGKFQVGNDNRTNPGSSLDYFFFAFATLVDGTVYEFLPTGGIEFGGSATTTQKDAYAYIPTGGIEFGGTATATTETSNSYTPTGGIEFGGSATITTSIIPPVLTVFRGENYIFGVQKTRRPSSLRRRRVRPGGKTLAQQ